MGGRAGGGGYEDEKAGKWKLTSGSVLVPRCSLCSRVFF